MILSCLSAAPQNEEGWTRVGVRTVADALGASESWAKAALGRLEAAGWIEVRRRRDPDTGADLPSERRVNWNNSLGRGHEVTTVSGEWEHPEGALLPQDFPTPELVVQARIDEPGLPMEDVIRRFREWHTQEESRRKSWPKAWKQWVKRAWKDYAHDGRQQSHRSLSSPRDARERATSARVLDEASRLALRRPDQERH